MELFDWARSYLTGLLDWARSYLTGLFEWARLHLTELHFDCLFGESLVSNRLILVGVAPLLTR